MTVTTISPTSYSLPKAIAGPMPSGPILITGCPRSGTTFVGSVFEASRDVFEVYEPFNADFTYHLNLPARFMHIDDTQGKALKPQFDRMLKLSSLPRRLTMLPRGAIDRMRTQRDMAGSLSLKKLVQNPKTFFSGSRLTIKDPIAFFSAEWIARTYDAPVIIMARHPAGVISSYLTLGWPPETPYIVDHHLPLSQGVLDADIAKYRKNPDDHLGGLILQWKLFTHYTMDLMQLHPDWKFFLHKHVCNSPMEAFTEMYAYAGLDMSERVRNFIGTNTRGNLVDPKSDHAQHMLTRNSASLPQAWKQRLDDDSARRILRETGELFEDLESRIAKGKRITWLSLSPQIAAE